MSVTTGFLLYAYLKDSIVAKNVASTFKQTNPLMYNEQSWKVELGKLCGICDVTETIYNVYKRPKGVSLVVACFP